MPEIEHDLVCLFRGVYDCCLFVHVNVHAYSQKVCVINYDTRHTIHVLPVPPNFECVHNKAKNISKTYSMSCEFDSVQNENKLEALTIVHVDNTHITNDKHLHMYIINFYVHVFVHTHIRTRTHTHTHTHTHTYTHTQTHQFHLFHAWYIFNQNQKKEKKRKLR